MPSVSRSHERHEPTRLLLNDADDALVPITPHRPEAPTTAQASSIQHAQSDARLTHPAYADARVLQSAVDWIASPEPALGARRLLLHATGINLGPSRREQRLRLLFCALYQASYDQKEGV